MRMIGVPELKGGEYEMKTQEVPVSTFNSVLSLNQPHSVNHFCTYDENLQAHKAPSHDKLLSVKKYYPCFDCNKTSDPCDICEVA